MLHISFRVDEEDLGLIKNVVRQRRENLSNFLRRALYSELAKLSYLSDEEKKALGINKKGGR